MAKSNTAGSDTLPGRIGAFGGLLVVFLGAGVSPFAAVALGLVCTYVLALV